MQFFFKKENGKYNGIIINFDGYIRCVNRGCFKNSYIEGLDCHMDIEATNGEAMEWRRNESDTKGFRDCGGTVRN